MVEAAPTLSSFVEGHPQSGSGDQMLASRIRDRASSTDGWQQVIDEYLAPWILDPTSLEEEDLEPPSLEILRLACRVARCLQDKGWDPPLRVVPDGEGGLVFERDAGACFQTLSILSSGLGELMTFDDCRLVSRVAMSFKGF